MGVIDAETLVLVAVDDGETQLNGSGQPSYTHNSIPNPTHIPAISISLEYQTSSRARMRPTSDHQPQAGEHTEIQKAVETKTRGAGRSHLIKVSH